MNSKRPQPFFVSFFIILWALIVLVASSSHAQNSGVDRVFQYSKSQVDAALQSLHATLNGRLPIFDGFVEKAGELSSQYGRGYYELAVETTAEGKQSTRVRITAKITAWYTDPAAAQSGYRVLKSNGRLEADLLARIEEALAPHPSATNGPQSSPSVNPNLLPSTGGSLAPSARWSLGSGNAPIHENSALPRSAPASPATTPSSSKVDSIGAVPTSAGDIDSLKQRREETERQISARKLDVQSLEEILANQSHPSDIAVVRKSGTRVLSKPSATASLLFSADADDEFQVLDTTPDWIHVQISGASRGWIHRADLNLPPGLEAASKQKSDSAAPSGTPFRVAREETSAFQGAWDALKGKTVKIFWAEPSPGSAQTSSAAVKKDFAKSLLVKAYQDITSHDLQGVAGVVIVFDSADGGQIAATVEDLKKWQTGALSDASFWQLCSVDPPELIRAASLAWPLAWESQRTAS